MIATVDRLEKAPPVDYPMTLEQFHHYLVAGLTSFHHVVVNGVANTCISRPAPGRLPRAIIDMQGVTAAAPATATAEAGAPPNPTADSTPGGSPCRPAAPAQATKPDVIRSPRPTLSEGCTAPERGERLAIRTHKNPTCRAGRIGC